MGSTDELNYFTSAPGFVFVNWAMQLAVESEFVRRFNQEPVKARGEQSVRDARVKKSSKKSKYPDL